MTIAKQAGAIIGAATLIGAGLVASTITSARAADLVVDFSAEQYVPGQTAVITLDGCPAGSTYTIKLPEIREIKGQVPASGEVDVEVGLPEDLSGRIEADATCQPAGGGTASRATDTAFVIDSFIEMHPDSGKAGDDVTITAGHFLPGTRAELRIIDSSGQTRFSASLGSADEDYTVKGQIEIPENLGCGTYTLRVASEDNEANMKLRLCAGPSPTVSPAPTSSSEPSSPPDPRGTPTSTPKPGETPQPTSTPIEPGQPGKPRPGLPKTGGSQL